VFIVFNNILESTIQSSVTLQWKNFVNQVLEHYFESFQTNPLLHIEVFFFFQNKIFDSMDILLMKNGIKLAYVS